MPKKKESKIKQEAEGLTPSVVDATEDAFDQIQDEQADKAAVVEKGADAEEVTPAEVDAMHIVKETEVTEEEADVDDAVREKVKAKVAEKGKKEGKTAKPKKSSKPTRSKKYQEVAPLVDRNKVYQLNEAIELVKKVSVSKFDGTIELHMVIAKKKTKGSTESARGVLHLPHGPVKAKKIVVLDEDMIEEIAKTKKVDFDIAVASPSLMPKVAKIAKILGPQGKMPDPKAGTVTDDVEKVKAELNSGRTDFRIDPSNIVHLPIAKISWEDKNIAENIKVAIAHYPVNRIGSAYITPTIGPSIKLDHKSIK